MSPGPGHRRAFTLLETVLAASIGSIVALAALGLFMTIDRTDAMLAARYRQIAALERTHRVMSRAFLSLVTSDRPRPQTRPTGAGGAGGAGGTPSTRGGGPGAPGGAPGSGAGSGAGEQPANQPPPPPARVRLGADPSMAGRVMVRPGTERRSSSVQLMEVVVHTLPTGKFMAQRPTTSPTADEETSKDEDTGRGEEDSREPPRLLSPTGKVYRGAFVLRPSAESAEAGEVAPAAWTLWWQPLPPAREDGTPPSAAEVAVAGAPFELASDITYLRWQVFDDRQRKQEYEAIWRVDLPAYVEVEVATTAGLWANWMFEVDWVDGSEAAPPSAGGDGEENTGEEPAPGIGANKIRTLK